MSIVPVLFVISLTLCHAQHDKSKRLLLNDPDSLTRLGNLERAMQAMKGELAQEKMTVSTLQADLLQEKQTVSKLLADLTQEKVIVSTLQADLTHEKITVTKLQVELADQKTKVLQLQQSSAGQGSTYVRWGRKQCSGMHTEMVYTGFAAGNQYHDSNYFGGPANMLCLPNNPELSNKTGAGSSELYGTEFQNGNFFGNGADDEDVPCSLCRSKTTTSSIMIPGRRTCYNGWKLEYSGILASGAYTHKPSEYICVDGHPEFLQGGDDNKDGHLLYGTSARCGSLPCPPYGKGLAVNCVVCSK